jgi:hypothetical protein
MDIEIVREMQKSKVIGELNVLISSYYNPKEYNDEKYREVKSLIDDMIDTIVSDI